MNTNHKFARKMQMTDIWRKLALKIIEQKKETNCDAVFKEKCLQPMML